MLLRYDPFRDVDRVTDQLFRTPPAVPFDAVHRGDHVELSFDLPGVGADNVDLTVERNVLTVRASRPADRREGDEVLAAERRHGDFTRQVLLGDTLDPEHVEADYRDGVLRVTIPVATAAKARKVAIGSGRDPAIVSASATESRPAKDPDQRVA